MVTSIMPARSAVPEWVESVKRKYTGGEASVFLLHGNVFDQLLNENEWCSLEDFIVRTLLIDKKDHVVMYEPTAGVQIVKTDKKTNLFESGDDLGLGSIEKVLLTCDRVAVIIRYADSVAPAGDEAMLSPADRSAAIRFHRWSLSSTIASKDNVVFLVSESLASINAKLLSNPRIAAIEIPLPNVDERKQVIQKANYNIPDDIVTRLAHQTSGLRAIHICQILSPKPTQGLNDAARRELVLRLLGPLSDAIERVAKLMPLTVGMSEAEISELIIAASPQTHRELTDPYAEVMSLVSRRKREIIERECAGLLEFLDSSVGLEAVGGNEEVKVELTRIANAIRSGDSTLCPMGVLLVGPMGTGKTFMARCFARSSGLTAVALKNFRSKWVGSTESNLEKALSMVRAMGPIMLVIDEGDRSFGSSSEGSDGGTSSRVVARIKEFMSDTGNRGRVLFVLMTNRPDRLDTDIKRAGRLDVKIPLFYPSSAEEVVKVMQALFKRYDVPTVLEPADLLELGAKLVDYSSADIEAVLLLSRTLTNRAVSAKELNLAFDDYLPSRDTAMIEYMNLLAVFEASRKSWLPPKYKSLTPASLSDSMSQARRLCGSRAAE